MPQTPSIIAQEEDATWKVQLKHLVVLVLEHVDAVSNASNFTLPQKGSTPSL